MARLTWSKSSKSSQSWSRSALRSRTIWSSPIWLRARNLLPESLPSSSFFNAVSFFVDDLVPRVDDVFGENSAHSRTCGARAADSVRFLLLINLRVVRRHREIGTGIHLVARDGFTIREVSNMRMVKTSWPGGSTVYWLSSSKDGGTNGERGPAVPPPPENQGCVRHL